MSVRDVVGSKQACTKFVLVGTQRSGTTFARTALGSHADILSLGEVFNLNKGSRGRVKPATGKNLGPGFSSWRKYSYKTYMESTMFRRLGHWLFRGTMTRRFLDELFAAPGYQAIGFKLMASQVRNFPSVLPYIKEHGVRVIHLLRENPFDILLSRLSMQVRGYAHSTSQSGNPVTLSVPTGNLVEELREIEKEGLQWKHMFEGRVPYVLVTYDNFVQNKKDVSLELLTFLGVDPGVELKSDLVKLNTRPVSDMVVNYAEVKACLQSTEFSWCTP